MKPRQGAESEPAGSNCRKHARGVPGVPGRARWGLRARVRFGTGLGPRYPAGMALETSDADRLLVFLAGNSAPCPACGYDLRDLRAPICPECGDELVLRVGLAHPQQGAFIAGLVGLAAGAGFSGLLCVYVVVAIVIQSRTDLPPHFWTVTLLPTSVEASGLAAWMRCRRRISRAPAAWRWALVVGCWALSLANVVLFAVLAR
jgi:hypothetical protein